MLNTVRTTPRAQKLHKSVQFESTLPADAVLAGVLRSVETEFIKRGLLPAAAGSPLWFLAETERNVFLWRQGLSLAQASDYEFWIDIPKLIAKRIKQLSGGTHENPFTNPGWGLTDQESFTESNFVDQERSYLEGLQALVSSIAAHAHALSVVGSQIESEMKGKLPKIVLPQG